MRYASERREEQSCVNMPPRQDEREKDRCLSTRQKASHKNEPWWMQSERGEDSSIYTSAEPERMDDKRGAEGALFQQLQGGSKADPESITGKDEREESMKRRG